ncbi:DNA cytosine methyltransferase [Anabaena sp. CCY 0017]|uniref:DNA cytosine methyltransferase n=1 Tax=Anabaena sp. CCY 0017 TaxID=3103866 RepID=UPI0039C720CB
MQGTQLDLFPHEDERNPIKKQKQPKLGRYERIQRELDRDNSDQYKTFVDISSVPSLLSKYTFVDLFCGAGGITQGLSQAGLTPLASVEISPIASATHKKNFPKCHHFCGDIEQFSAQDWLQQIGSPEVNVVVGGPPCQGFSVAGKRDPKDPRNRLFYEFVRVVSEIRPWYVVMENVPGILTIQKGSVKTAIIEAFKSIGYPHISVAILESAAYGVPHIRPRAIFIANRFGMPNPYPKSQLSIEEYKPIESAISDLPDYTPIPEINHEWTYI